MTYESDYQPPESQVAPPPSGSTGSMYSSVRAMSKTNAVTQNNLNKIGGSRSRSKSRSRSRKGGATSGPVITHAENINVPATQGHVSTNNTITVPVVKPLYPETGTGNQTTASNVANSTKVGAELNANKQYDSCVGQGATCGQVTVTTSQKGGQRGGWPRWRCMSGGKYRRRRSNKRRTNKRKTNKRKGTNKRR